MELVRKNRNLSTWAKEFIERENLGLNDLKFSRHYLNLEKSEKDAVRYQLKKRNFTVSEVPVSRTKKEKNASPRVKSTKKNERGDFSFTALIVGGVISSVLIFDFYQFYLFEGLGKGQAVTIAILVELCVLYGACSNSRRLFKLSKALIVYNAIIFSFFGILQFGEYTKNLRFLEGRITELKIKLESFAAEKKELQGRLGVLYEKNVVTQASKSIFPEIQRIEGVISSQRAELQALQAKALEFESHSDWQKRLSLALMVVLRLILQIFSIELIHKASNKKGRL